MGEIHLTTGCLVGSRVEPLDICVRPGTATGFEVPNIPDHWKRELHYYLSILPLPARLATLRMNPQPKGRLSGWASAIVLGFFSSTRGELPPEVLERLSSYVYYSDLHNQELRHTYGALPAASMARRQKMKGIVLSTTDAREVSHIEDIEVIGVRDLDELFDFVRNGSTRYREPSVPREQAFQPLTTYSHGLLDMYDIVGLREAKFATEVAVAGGHTLLFQGAAGSGRTVLARRLPGIMPPLSYEEALEVAEIYSAAMGEYRSRVPPIRVPHHTVSEAGLVGSRAEGRCGEVSLAHRGVLFLDELPEFRLSTLESLWRRQEIVGWPTPNYLLVGAMNLCPCGRYDGSMDSKCTCTPEVRERYQNKVSKVLRFDLTVRMRAPALNGPRTYGETSADIQSRIISAREAQSARGQEYLNRDIPTQCLATRCPLDASATRYAESLANRGLNAAEYDLLLRVARTCADLAQRTLLTDEDVQSAARLCGHASEEVSE